MEDSPSKSREQAALPATKSEELPTPDRLSFWQELKRRKVTRVAITYAVVAWLIMQVAGLTFENFDIPVWAFRFVVIMLVCFFPVSVILTWAFELTPAGIKTTRSARAERGLQSQSRDQQRRRNWMAFGFAAGLPTVIFGSLAIFFFLRSSDGSNFDQEMQSIAVLPFTAFSAEEEERFFADGLSDTLLHKLAQLRGLRVISRSSSFQYRGDSIDVRKVGEELNVATVLEGSVQRSGDRLRIIAQLINTGDGGHIWSKTFDRSSEDTFAIHDEIANAVVQTLSVETSEAEKERLDYNGTSSVEAYTLLTLIRERSNMRDGFNLEPKVFEQEQLQLIEDLQKVLKIDPNYAEVYRVRANLYSGIVFRGAGGSRDYYIRKGFEAVRQAMLLEPTNPRNFVYYADLARRNGDPVTAETFSRLALSELPNDSGATVVLLLSLIEQGKNADECLALVEKEESLGTEGFAWRRKVMALGMLGRYEDALGVILKVLRGPKLSQIAADDYVNMQSSILGRHPEAVIELIAYGNRLGDSASSTFWAAWLTVAANVGMEEEVRKIFDQSAGFGGTEAMEVRFLWSHGRYQEAVDWLDAKGWDWYYARAKSLMMLGDFEAAVENYILQHETLESRQSDYPYLLTEFDFQTALPLIVCYRKAGESEAAARLLSEVDEFVAVRKVDGRFRTDGYDLCIYHLLKGEKTQALEEMKKRIDLEEDDFVPLREFQSFSSPVFDSVRQDEVFQRLVAEYERRKKASAAKIEVLMAEAGLG